MMWGSWFSSGDTPEVGNMADEVAFTINGKSLSVRSRISASTTLNAYIRETLKLTGTKVNCYEGTCGACIVVAKIEHPVTKKKETFSINSCLVPILSCHGWEITTIEGVGNRKDNYHQVQTQLAQCNGTQCGFCTPGFVMNMFSLVSDEKKPTMAEVENAFGSNICRCTGYRSILEAYKAMASDAPPHMQKKCADIEDLYKLCSKTGEACSGECKKSPVEQIKIQLGAENWHKVTTLAELFGVFGQIGDEKYKLVAGNTAEGVFRTRDITRFIDIKDIPELRNVETTPAYKLGANATLTEAIQAFKLQSATEGFAYLKEVADYWEKVANIPIGTVGGNLALKKEHPDFVSDIFTALEAIGAQVNVLLGVGNSSRLSLTGYLNYDMRKKVIQSIEFPSLDQNYVLRTFHVLPRAQSTISQVNAAFLIKKASSTAWDLTEQPRIVFGGISPQFIHATATEVFLGGKNLLDANVVTQAINTLNSELNYPDDKVKPGASPDYRRKTAVGLFYKFLLGLDPEKVNPAYRSGAEPLTRELSKAQQDFDTNKSVYPLNEPIPKIEALPQCSGETQFVNDMPEKPGELHAAYVLTKQATGKITGYQTDSALAVSGVVAFYSAADLGDRPNSFTPPDVLGFTENEEIFCSGEVRYAGQPAGIVVAENRAAALQGASLVEIKFSSASIAKPVLSTKEGGKTKEKLTIIKDQMTSVQPKAVNKVKGIFEIGNQYPLYMENLSCIVEPNEDGYDVYSSTQWMDLDQIVVARTVGVPVNKVNVHVKRIGGGFGGKQSRSGMLVAACALAAKKQNRPVRLTLPLSTNFEITSKRFAQRNEYEVGFDENGKIEYAIVDVFQDSGCSHNESPMPIFPIFFDSCYGSEGYKIAGHEVLTDKASNGPIRGPGPIEGVAFHDEIMERIAKSLKKDPLEIKLLNMETINSPLPNMISDLQQKSDYAARKAAVATFNSENRWKKRGMAITPMRYPFMMWNHLTSHVSIYHGDGSVGIAHGGIEMGQGLNTKVSQVAAHILGLPIDQISIKPSNTNTGANCNVSGGSIISEGVSYATMKACQILLERLEPVKASMNNPTWPKLIQEAYVRNVNLSAQFLFQKYVPDVKDYNIWAVCVSEVEVDVLTGEKQVVRVDLLEDVGQSLSPLIDIGQIEGAFVMGLGYWLSEEMNFDPTTGRLLENRLWHYVAPGAKDIPADFRIYLRKNAPNPLGVLGSKSTGEPAICLSVNVWFAIRNALDSARKDAAGPDEYFDMKHPATNEHIYEMSLSDPKQFHL